MKKKIWLGFFIIAIAMLIGILINPVYATETIPTGEGTAEAGSTDIIFTSDPILIKFKGPIQLPVHVDSNGEILTSDQSYLQNLSAAGGIEVIGIQLNTKNGWVLEDFTYPDYINLPVNSKIYGFQIFSDNADPLTGNIPLNSPEWKVIPSAGLVEVTDPDTGEVSYEDNVDSMVNRLYLRYDAKAGVQSTSLPETAIGNVMFIVDFVYAE